MIIKDKWLLSGVTWLEPNAMRAVKELDSCVALIAGPGAGKTEVLAQRADFLLRTGSCRYPKRILAISFKTDASKNLKDRVRLRSGADLASRFDSYTFHGFAKRIVDRFRPVLTDESALPYNYTIGNEHKPNQQITFSQLIPLAIRILTECTRARNAINQTYKHVFLDEFQDCTADQYALIRLLFAQPQTLLTAVGDTKQKIMGFAGAVDGIFEDYVEDFEAVPFNLYSNFRSKPRLLRVQNEIIRVLEPKAVMLPEMLEGDQGEILAEHFANSDEEAEALADLIEKWVVEENLPPAEIAVVISKQVSDYGASLMEKLAERNIPYRNDHDVQDLVKEPAVRLIVDYLTCLYDSPQPKAWARLTEHLTPLDSEAGHERVQNTFDKLYREHLKEITQAAKTEDPYTGWWSYALAFVRGVGLAELTSLSGDYEAKARLNELIQRAKLQIEKRLLDEPNLLKALESLTDEQSVRFLTLHKSKGLEYHSVIVLGVETQIFYNKPEERCAFFVGVSRAKDRLVITTCERRFSPPSNPPFWKEQRTQHAEFVTYVTPHLTGRITV
jgi:superfamily I DNA/RNA helicase